MSLREIKHTVCKRLSCFQLEVKHYTPLSPIGQHYPWECEVNQKIFVFVKILGSHLFISIKYNINFCPKKFSHFCYYLFPLARASLTVPRPCSCKRSARKDCMCLDREAWVRRPSLHREACCDSPVLCETHSAVSMDQEILTACERDLTRKQGRGKLVLRAVIPHLVTFVQRCAEMAYDVVWAQE